MTIPPGTSKNFVKAQQDVTGLKCSQDRGSWVVTGKVTNPSTTKVNYRIYTLFADKDTHTRGLLESDVNGVAPKATKGWTGKLDLPYKDLKCRALQVERTKAT